MAREEIPLATVRIVGGHTQIGGGASVQLGATCRVNVDHIIDGVHAEEMLDWLGEKRDFFTEDQIERMTADVSEGYLARAMLGALGLVMGDGDYERYQNAQDVELKAGSPAQVGFMQALQTLKNRRLRLASEIEMYGTSMTPTVAAVFARVVQIHFADGSSLNFVDLADPVAASSTGDTGSVRATKSQRLCVLPPD